MKKCYECEKGNLKRKAVEYRQYGVLIGKFPAEVCDKCKEVFYDGSSVDKIEKKLKKLKLWGLGTKTKIGTSGTALDIKLSRRLVKFYHMQKGF